MKEVIQYAIDRDLFGVPTMLVEDELFWGYDSLDRIDRKDRCLAGADPLPHDLLERWAQVARVAYVEHPQAALVVADAVDRNGRIHEPVGVHDVAEVGFADVGVPVRRAGSYLPLFGVTFEETLGYRHRIV